MSYRLLRMQQHVSKTGLAPLMTTVISYVVLVQNPPASRTRWQSSKCSASRKLGNIIIHSFNCNYNNPNTFDPQALAVCTFPPADWTGPRTEIIRRMTAQLMNGISFVCHGITHM
ncbi:unnamed protein product, partial [Nesidiocoris tenuis]